MANKKFSEFELKTTTSNVSHVVGYDGVENVRITPANFLDTTGGPYLPLAGGLMVGNTTHNDNVKSIYGDSGDLEIYHSGAGSYIVDNGTGNLDIRADSLSLLNAAGNEYYARFYTNGAAYLYNNGVAKFYTTGTGAEVIGDLLVTGTITGVGGSYLPLAGGTLTGALTGTSATFGGVVTINNNTPLIINGSDALMSFQNSAVNHWQVGLENTQSDRFVFYDNNASAYQLILESTTGNATFGGDVIIAEATNKGQLFFGTADTNYEIKGGGNFGYLSLNAPILRFDTGGSEKMRLDASGNLGLGTSTPTSGKLEIQQGTTTAALWVQTGGTTSSYTIADFRTGTNLSALNIKADGNSTFGGNVTVGSNFLVSSAATEYAYVNFGATTGYGWQVGKAPDTGGIVDDQGFYVYNLNTGYTGVNLAVLKSGNVGVGTSTPTVKLDVDVDNGTAITRTTMSAADGYRGGFEASNTHTGGATWSMFSTNNSDGYFGGGKFVIANETMSTVDASTPATVVIDSAGNIEQGTVGTTAAGYYYFNSTTAGDSGFLFRDNSSTNSGFITYNHSVDAMKFAAGGSERMRISSGGEVNIGGTTSTGKLTVESTGNHLHLRNTSATAGKFWNFDIASNNRLYILTNGNTGVYIDDGDTSWTGISDESLKENIKPLNNVLNKIKDYRCVEYNLKSDDTKGKKIGFIAQDWEGDFAPIISKDNDGLLGMKYTETIPVLLKAIQELTAKVEKLELNK